MRRELPSLAAALAAHALFIAGATRLPPSTLPSAPAPGQAVELTFVDVDPQSTETPTAARAAAPVLVRDAPLAPSLPAAEAPPPAPTQPEAPPPAPTQPEAPPSEPTPSEPAAVDPTLEERRDEPDPAEPPATEENADAEDEAPDDEPRVDPVDAPPPEPVAAIAPSPSPAPPEIEPGPPNIAGPPAPPAPVAPSGGQEVPAMTELGEPGAPPGNASPPASAPGGADGWSTDDAPRGPAGAGVPGVPGLGGVPVWASLPSLLPPSAAAAAPTRAPAARPVDPESANRTLASTMRSRDASLGVSIPAATQVTSAVSDATRAVPVPHGTRASFEVRLAPDGSVVGAKVHSASGGDAAAWDAAAKGVAASLRGQRLAMGADGAQRGATVVVSVTTKHVYPAGTSKRAEVKPVCANQLINDLADAASNAPPSPPSEARGPSLFTDENGRPCIPIGVAGLSDVSNLGATKQIQVQTRTQVKLDDAPDLPSAPIQRVDTSAPWVTLGDATAPRPTMPFKIRRHEQKRAKRR